MRSCRRLFSASVQGSFVRPGRQWCIHLIWQSSGERARLMWESVQMPCHASSSKAIPISSTSALYQHHSITPQSLQDHAEAAEEGSGALDSIQPAVKLSKHQESSMVVLRKPPLHQSSQRRLAVDQPPRTYLLEGTDSAGSGRWHPQIDFLLLLLPRCSPCRSTAATAGAALRFLCIEMTAEFLP